MKTYGMPRKKPVTQEKNCIYVCSPSWSFANEKRRRVTLGSVCPVTLGEGVGGALPRSSSLDLNPGVPVKVWCDLSSFVLAFLRSFDISGDVRSSLNLLRELRLRIVPCEWDFVCPWFLGRVLNGQRPDLIAGSLSRPGAILSVAGTALPWASKSERSSWT